MSEHVTTDQPDGSIRCSCGWSLQCPAVSAYPELADLIEQLPVLVRGRRQRGRLSLRTAAEQCGVSFNTITRVEHGKNLPSGENLVKVLRWLGAEQ